VSWYERRRFEVLLAALILMFALDALIGAEARRHAVGTVYSLVIVLTAVGTFPPGRRRMAAIVLAAIALGGHLAGYFTTGMALSVATFADYVGGALFLFYALAMILSILLHEHEITIDTISGAVCGYLLLGLGCGWLYSLIETLSPGSFFTARQDFVAWLKNDHLRRSLLSYYSFATLSTAGFGDITPVSQPARTVSWAEAVAGQFYMAILVAGLVGIRISQILQFRAGKSPSADTTSNALGVKGTGEKTILG
jgi:voltage-gated potassium channel